MKVKMPDALIDAFKSGRVIPFVGSGLSSVEAAGYPSASTFARSLCSQVVTDTAGEPSKLIKLVGGDLEADRLGLDDIAEYYELFAGSDRLLEVIRGTFNNATISATTLHRDLWELPNISQIYTTNFDPLIEKGLEMSRVRAEPHVIIHPQGFEDASASDYHVFKLHGCAVRSERREDFVITKSDYLDFQTRHPLRKLKAQSELIQNVFLFMGYSLDDSDFQSLYREVRSFAGSTAQSCFAVIPDVSAAKVEYWKRLGLHILKARAEDIVTSIRTDEKLGLHTSWFEWRGKQGAREDIKQAIAQKALTSILTRPQLQRKNDKIHLTVILDSGTSTLAFAKRLKDLLDARSSLFDKVETLSVLTNCTAIINELQWVHLPEYRSKSRVLPTFSLYVLGGKLRTETQALIPPKPRGKNGGVAMARSFISACLGNMGNREQRIALVGATGVTSDGFSTNTEQEVAAKQVLIEAADQVVFLLDHSKFRIGGKCLFLSCKDARTMVETAKKAILVVTDREPPQSVTSVLKDAGIKIGLIAATDLWGDQKHEITTS